MKKINKSFLFPLIALIILLYALSHQLFILPPLGKLLDPFVGAVQNNNDKLLTVQHLNMDLPDLSDSVNVYFDERKVPHIYAKNANDLYFTQGYVVASLRLWQMDFLSYVSSGRLSEILGPDNVLGYDRNQRRLGILEAARKSLQLIEQNPETSMALTAYSNGVNAYIGQLDYKTLPFEYKLLDYKPEPWTNLKSVLLIKYMANMLSGYEEDMYMSNLILTLGDENFNKLFPDFQSRSNPVMNTVLKDTAPPFMQAGKPEYLSSSFLSSNAVLPKSSYNPKLGSNSWAVSGKKTKSGYPILCSDPHLGLSLPSIWLEMQLSSPDVNVYGVSIPGTPAVVIGFNENIAWGITNGSDDVKDWFKLKLTDDYKKYEFDGEWKELKYTIEEIKLKGGAVFADTVYYTVHGPVVYNGSFEGKHPELKDYALKWELHNASNEFLSFIQINRAKNYTDFKNALKYYTCPIQNFTFAGKDNNIAINHHGKLPLKWRGQGKFVLDGTRSDHLYTSYIPMDSMPQLNNPDCNYVLSANQHPTNVGYNYYYNGYFSETRANRIHQLLDTENEFDIQKMKAIQLDNVNSFAAEAAPTLVRMLPGNSIAGEHKKLYALLAGWKGSYGADDEAAELFEIWWKTIKEYTWDELKQFSFYLRAPDDFVLLDLLQKEPSNSYFDKQGTSPKENAGDIVQTAFKIACSEYEELKKTQSLKWGDYHKVNIMHMTNIPAFGKTDIPTPGHPEAINAIDADWGPSWRMIVELGDKPTAYGIYGGGQSGNVASPYYDNFVNDWHQGNYYPLYLFTSAKEAKEHTSASWTLTRKAN